MRYIIDFINDATEKQIQTYLAKNNANIVSVFSSFEKCFLVDSTATPAQDKIVSTITDDAENIVKPLIYPINAGQTLPEISFNLTDDNEWWKVSSMDYVDWGTQVCNFPRRGDAATVYIVDSGIKKSHPEFIYADIDDLFTFNGDFADYNGHGTALASLISGNTCGMTNAKIKSVKIFQSGVDTKQSDLLAAIDSIITDIKANPYTFPVINLSWSIPRNSYIEDKLRILIACGAAVVTAAGNSGIPIENVTPAAMGEVITVGSYDRNFNPCAFSDYTSSIQNTENDVNHGSLNIWAPGEGIRVAMLGDTYGISAGTSISAAIHSAALAYSAWLSILSDGSPAPILSISKTAVSSQLFFSAGRQGILHLDGKYSASVNNITGFLTYKEGYQDIRYAKPSGIRIIANSGEKFGVPLISGVIADNVTVNNTFPAGVMVDNQWIIGSITSDTLVKWSGTYGYTAFNGIVKENLPIEIIVLPSGIDRNTADLTDPTIGISLLQAICGGTYFTSGAYYCEINASDCSSCVACGTEPGKTASAPQPCICYTTTCP
jgi:subtilisin family serine protease